MSSIEPDWVRIGIDILQIVMTVLIAVYVFLTQRHLANKTAIETLRSDIGERDELVNNRMIQIQERLAASEHTIKYMPNDESLRRLHVRIDDLNKGLSRIEGKFEGSNHTLQLIQKYLMSLRDAE